MQDITSLVSVSDGKTTTTSLKIAEVFGKQHKDILKAIRDLDCPDEFAERNFAPGTYKDANNQDRPMYFVTRDGFTLLAMGFTGEKAMQFKIAYIDAFNAMEKVISEARRGMIPEEYAILRSEAIIRENERMRQQIEMAKNFLPHGQPGEISKETGRPKLQFRCSYYTSGRGKPVSLLIESFEQPELFPDRLMVDTSSIL